MPLPYNPLNTLAAQILGASRLPTVSTPQVFNSNPLPAVPKGDDSQVYAPLLHLLLNSGDLGSLNPEAQKLTQYTANAMTPTQLPKGYRPYVGPVPSPLGLLSPALISALLAKKNGEGQ